MSATVGQTMVPCGGCRMCQRGRRALCERLAEVGLYGLQGAAAEYIRMPARSLTVLPDALSDLSAAMIEPAVTVVGGFDKVGCGLADEVAVIGTGTLGLLAEAGVLKAEPLVAAVLPPEDAGGAFALLERGRSGPPNVLLGFEDGQTGAADAPRRGEEA